MFINKSLFEIRYLFVSNGHERKRFLTYRYLQLLTNVSHYLSLAMTVFQKEKEKSNQRTSYHSINPLSSFAYLEISTSNRSNNISATAFKYLHLIFNLFLNSQNSHHRAFCKSEIRSSK